MRPRFRCPSAPQPTCTQILRQTSTPPPQILPPRLQKPRRRTQQAPDQHRARRPHLRAHKPTPVRRLQRAADGRARHRREADDAERHAHARADHVEARGDARDRGGDEALEGGGQRAVEGGPGEKAGHVGYAQPAEGDDGPECCDGDDDVEGPEAVREEGDEDAEGEAAAVDYDYEDRGCGVAHAKGVGAEGGNLCGEG